MLYASATLCYDLPRVLAFMRQYLPGLKAGEGQAAIGRERRGRLVAGALYEGFNGRNIWMHVAAEPGAWWMTRTYLRACFAYPFRVCKVERITGYVDESNARSVHFVQRLGFRPEARLAGAAPDGSDVTLYVMRRADCRWLEV